MWCNTCKAEFDAPDNICPTCQNAQTEAVFLVAAANEIEAQIIIAKMEAADIPVLTKHRESGSYMKIYMGTSIFGMDLYVPAGAYEDAKELPYATQILPEDIKDEDFAATQKEADQTVGQTKFLAFCLFGILFFLLLLYWAFAG